MSETSPQSNRRILVVDDSPAIHEDFKKILQADESTGLSSARAAFLGGAEPVTSSVPSFEVDSAYQGQEALVKLQMSLDDEKPFAMAFVDIRMPPGWDGIETIERLWRIAPDLQTVICTAFSDYSWEQIFERLGGSDRLLILKKPFDPTEISQLAAALTEKWNVERRVGSLIEDLRRKEQEARAYASSLETVNRALKTSKAAAEKSSEMKTEFLVHLSREIRTKVSGVVGDVEKLCAPGADEQFSLGMLDSVFHSSSYLLSTLDEAADLALIESGKLEIGRSDFDPSEPMTTVANELRERAETKGLELWVESRSPLPELVQGDPARMCQILRNLLSNAIKYTAAGSVRLTLEARSSKGWGGTGLCYAVEDTGVGIPRQHLGRVFEPFTGALDGKDHAGLGLAHARRLARLMGGDVVVESEPGSGSRFLLHIDVPTRSGARAE